MRGGMELLCSAGVLMPGFVFSSGLEYAFFLPLPLPNHHAILYPLSSWNLSRTVDWGKKRSCSRLGQNGVVHGPQPQQRQDISGHGEKQDERTGHCWKICALPALPFFHRILRNILERTQCTREMCDVQVWVILPGHRRTGWTQGLEAWRGGGNCG